MNSSFASVSSQIVNYNNNIVTLLSNLNTITTSNQSSISVDLNDEFGNITTYNIPSFGYLLNEIKRLNNNLNTLYSIDSNGALIQGANNLYKKIITVDLNREPNVIDTLNPVSLFKSSKNWFFDGLMNPILSVEIDLNDKVDDSVRKVLSRRYIPEFQKTDDGDLTTLGLSAVNSFNQLFRGRTNILLDEYLTWHSTTPGIYNPNTPNYDEQMFDLEPNELLYDGIFSVLETEEDTLNRKLWFHLDTLDYIVTETNERQELKTGDDVIINNETATTRYRVIEVSKTQANPRVRFELQEGIEAIPVLTGALKIYSPLVNNKRVNISIGYDERNIIFLKSMDANNHLLAKDWSGGTAFWTNDLTLQSSNDDNGKSMEQYYSEKVYDYGLVLRDVVQKNIPFDLGVTPSSPLLLSDNFKVVQVNKHLTDNPDTQALMVKHNKQKELKSELVQLNDAIVSKNKELTLTKFSSNSAQKQFKNDLNALVNKQESKSKLLNSTVNEIISLSSNVVNKKILPKYKVRGFWDIPNIIETPGTKQQEVIQFKIEYRYLSNSGKENPIESFAIKNADDTLSENAVYSNWIPMLSDVRKRVRNAQTGEWEWAIEDVSDADTPNINQIEVSIQKGEKVQIRIKSISEVGYPDSPLESEWSEILEVEFPDDLSTVLGDTDFILKEANQEEVRVRINDELNAKGLDTHLSQTNVINGVSYHHDDTKILMSAVKDEQGNQISLFDYINKLEKRISTLEEQITNAKGIMKIVVLRDDEEFAVKNNEELSFNVECEDYLETFTGDNVPTGRVYENSIYVIKDFVVRVENTASSSPLGLLSNRSYFTNSDFMRTDAPQSFFVNDRDELLSSTSNGSTRTQLNNQFLWLSNYVSLDQTSVVKISDNVGNDFQINNSNSMTDVLSSTEYNVGYEENTIINLLNNNNSLLEVNKWVDNNISVTSNTKLLTTVHPVVQTLNSIVENNSDKIKTVNSGSDNSLQIPLNIYFKMNSLDPNSGSGNNFDYVNLNNLTTSSRHIKRCRFFLENEADNRPFMFTIRFNINRNKVGIQKISKSPKTVKSPIIK